MGATLFTDIDAETSNIRRLPWSTNGYTVGQDRSEMDFWSASVALPDYETA